MNKIGIDSVDASWITTSIILGVSLLSLPDEVANTMTLVLELPDNWRRLLGLDTHDAAARAREMLVIESYRESRLSRGQASEMLGLGFYEVEALFQRYGANQQPTWDELEHSARELRPLIGA